MCVCVCVRERERERKREKGVLVCVCVCVYDSGDGVHGVLGAAWTLEMTLSSWLWGLSAGAT
jgi:hypothetical protein